MKNLIYSGLIIAVVLSGCDKGEDRQIKYLERAKEYYAEGNFEKSKIEARNVLQINPKNTEAQTLLGDILLEGGDIRKAYGTYQGVLQETPDNIQANIGLSKIFIMVKDYESLLDKVDLVLEKDPGNTEAKSYKAIGLSATDKEQEAEKLAFEVLEVNPSSGPALGVLVRVLGKKDQEEEALSLVNKGIENSPDQKELYVLKAALLEVMERNEEVEPVLTKLVNDNPESSLYSDMLVRYYVKSGEFDKAEKEVRAYAANNENSVNTKKRVIAYLRQHGSQEAAVSEVKKYIEEEPQVGEYYTVLAKLHFFVGDKDKGKAVLNNLIDKLPLDASSVDARVGLAAFEVELENYGKAKSLLNDALEIESGNEQALMSRALILLRDNNLDSAIADLRVLLKNNPQNARALKTLANAQELRGDKELALNNYQRLLQITEPDVETLAAVTRLSLAAEDYDNAEKYLRQALEIDQENASLVLVLVRLLALKEDWTEAQQFIDRLLAVESSKALGYYLQAGLNLKAEEFEKAIDNLDKSLNLRPTARDALKNISAVISETQGREAALSYVQNHCKAHSDFSYCYFALGSLQADQQDYTSAEKSLEKAISLKDDDREYYSQLSRVYFVSGKANKIEDLLNAGIEKTEDVSLQVDLALFHYGQKQYQKAKDIYKKIIKQENGAELLAKNNLAMINVENLKSEENIKEAQSLIVDLQESENPAYLDTVGWVLYHAGEYNQAIRYLQAAVDKLESQPVLQYHLGMAYYKAGDMERAKNYLSLATSDPNATYDGKEEAIKILGMM